MWTEERKRDAARIFSDYRIQFDANGLWVFMAEENSWLWFSVMFQ